MKHLILAAALAAAPLASQAAVVLDQQDPVVTGSTAVGFVTTDLAQTFTVGVTGVFAAVELNISSFSLSHDPLTVSLRKTAGIVPSTLAADILATTTITAADANAALTDLIDFSFAGVGVTAGDFLAIVVTPAADQTWELDFDVTNAYADGRRVSATGGVFGTPSSSDLTFATYVDAAPGSDVPLPAAAPLMALGLGALGLAARRRG
ncbi:VPLPA-CTERM sorting domain-containing protein [Rhodovulum sp. DZ06]|uniref:VPLPA-CTERM sorting domain-containing protein n=1 Tax=Rhodovulum sp. DZ06 TaxID=3425126 RepID=UPI003D33563A